MFEVCLELQPEMFAGACVELGYVLGYILKFASGCVAVVLKDAQSRSEFRINVYGDVYDGCMKGISMESICCKIFGRGERRLTCGKEREYGLEGVLYMQDFQESSHVFSR